MFLRTLLVTAVSGLLAAAAPLAARADVLFDTFGAGNTYASGGTLVTGANSIFTRFAEADRFTAAFSGNLSQLDVAVALGSGASTSAGFIDLEIAPNNPANNLPLVTGALTLGTIQTTSTTPTVLSLTAFSSSYLFTAGATYWLILAPHDASTNTLWEGATNSSATVTASMSQTTNGQFAASNNGANAFRVSATPAPEPSTWALLFAGAVILPGMTWWQRRRHTGLLSR